MIKFLVNEGDKNVSIIKRSSPYSIVKDDMEIILSSGYNELKDLKNGFFFNVLSDVKRVENIDLTEYDTSKINSMCLMFSGYLSTSINVSNFNTKNVTNMGFMFSGCKNLVELDLSSFDTNNIFTVECIFSECKSLIRLDLSKFDLTKTRFCNSMFCGCDSLKTIRCTKKFKDWCLDNKNIISLPYHVRKCHNFMWEIVN